MGSNSKFLNRKKESIVSVEKKQDQESKYFFGKFNGIYSPQNNFRLKQYAFDNQLVSPSQQSLNNALGVNSPFSPLNINEESATINA